MSATSEAEHADVDCDTVTLHPEGDVAIVVCEQSGGKAPESRKRFIASSHSLSMVSPYFRTLFGPNFQEGSLVREGGRPDIFLKDDYLEAMEVVLSLLHFKTEVVRTPLPILKLAEIARQCDKYQCTEAVRPFLFESFNFLYGQSYTLNPLQTEKEIALAVISAYLLKHNAHWERILETAFKSLSLNFLPEWFSLKLMLLLPKSIAGAIHSSIRGHVNSTLKKLHETISELMKSNDKFVMTQNPSADVVLYCSPKFRASRFVEALEIHNLWPSVSPFQTWGGEKLRSAFSEVRLYISGRHECEAGHDCPLKKAAREVHHATFWDHMWEKRNDSKKLISWCKRESEETGKNEVKKRKLEKIN